MTTTYKLEDVRAEGIPEPPDDQRRLETNESSGWECYMCRKVRARVLMLPPIDGHTTFACTSCLFELVRDRRLQIGVVVAQGSTEADAELQADGSTIVGDLAFTWS